MKGDIRPPKIHATRDDCWGRFIALRYGQEVEGVGLMVAQPVTMAPVERNKLVEPFLRLEPHEAQELMDSLWDCGLRPSEGSGSAGALRATERHLEDMRQLVFDTRKSSPAAQG